MDEQLTPTPDAAPAHTPPPSAIPEAAQPSASTAADTTASPDGMTTSAPDATAAQADPGATAGIGEVATDAGALGADASGLDALPTDTAGADALLSNPYGIEALWAQGDLIIKSVAVLLLLMSIASWYVIISRGLRAMRLRHAAKRAQRFWHAQNIEEGIDVMGGDATRNPFRRLVEDGTHARDHHVARREELHGQLSLSDWLTACLRTAIDESAERMQSGLSVLASVGSTAPFVGLFGTVWGIYHALVGIGVSGQASIDKVAGPVGEALIMTAFGLAVAIPAVLGYNVLVRNNKGVLGQLNRFAHHLHAFLVTGAPVSNPRLKVARIAREA
ncbi:MAG: MotA/TolQ/ExbB proton channel family protein [Rhodocyclaceae bacterium]